MAIGLKERVWRLVILTSHWITSRLKSSNTTNNQQLLDREEYVTVNMVRNTYQSIGTEYETLLGRLISFKKKYKRNDISMLELTPDFIKEYKIIYQRMQGFISSIWENDYQKLTTMVKRIEIHLHNIVSIKT